MKSLYKFAKWALVGMTALNLLGTYGQILPIVVFLAAIAVMLPPAEPLVFKKFPFLEKSGVRFIVWLLLTLLGFHLVTTSAEHLASAQQKVAQLESQKNVKELITTLQQRGQSAQFAAQALGNLGDQQAVEPLITALKTAPELDTRRNAATALGKLQDPRAVPPLTDALQDKDGGVKESAKGALKQLVAKDPQVVQLESQKNVKELITLLQQKDYRSPYIAELLGNLGDKQAVEPLIAALKFTTPKDIRPSAATALGKLQDSRAVQALVDALKDQEAKQSAKGALKQLAAKDATVVEAILPAFKKGDAIAKEAVVSIGDPAIDPVIKTLQEPEDAARRNAIEVLGAIGNPRAIPPLVANLTDWELSPLVGKTLETLKWTPQSDADKIHRLVAMRNGSDLRKNWSTTRQVLLQDVESGDPRRIDFGLYSFMSIGNRDVVPTLVKLLNERGDKTLALAYLNCGESTLEKSAVDWANANGYQVVRSPNLEPKVKWGGL